MQSESFACERTDELAGNTHRRCNLQPSSFASKIDLNNSANHWFNDNLVDTTVNIIDTGKTSAVRNKLIGPGLLRLFPAQ